jgi:uncharacterized membrane protein YqiK
MLDVLNNTRVYGFIGGRGDADRQVAVTEEDEKRELRIESIKRKLDSALSPIDRADLWRKLQAEVNARSPEMTAKVRSDQR